MKKIPLLVIVLFIGLTSKAQDTIVKISGDIVLAKISEITPTEIKYKRFDFQDGPTYIELKSNVSMLKFSNGLKEIIKQEPTKTPVTANNTTPVADKVNDYYGNKTPILNNKIENWGSRYRYQNRTLNEREMHELLLKTNNKQIMSLVGQAKDAKSMQYVGFAAIPLGITSYVFLLKSFGAFSTNYSTGISEKDLAVSAVCAAAAITCPIISGISKGKRNKYNRLAVKIYNEKF